MGRILTSPVLPPAPPRRPVCPACLRPHTACICRFAVPVPADAALLILQHPLEVANAKGSARLLHLCIPGSVMVTGEYFDAASLAALLYADGRTPWLLYPGEGDPAGAGSAAAPSATTGNAGLRLVVLDGTWRKSRKMLHLNPVLTALPRLALRDMPPSHYRIRKAHRTDQLSSFEAAAYALMQLQRDRAAGAAGIGRLLAAFDGFVDQQATFSGAVPSAHR